MGRTKTKTRTPSFIPPPTAHSPASSKSKPKLSIESLLDKAQKLLGECDYDLARRFVQRALEMDQSHVEARELLGIVEVERGELESAKNIFLTLVPPSTTAASPPAHSVYLYLAQLVSDDDARQALKYYQAALDLLFVQSQSKGKDRADVTTEPGTDDEEDTKSTIVTACVSMVELWMTDLCFEPDAEQKCEELLRVALEAYPGNAEAMLSLASVRMSQQREEEAEQDVQAVWNAWQYLDFDDPLHPTPPTLLSFTRICLELKLYSLALAAIQRTLEMDDQEVEAWYLEGWTFWLMSEDAPPRESIAKPVEGEDEVIAKEDMWRDARDCLDTCLMLHTTQSHPDQQLLSHVTELLGELSVNGVEESSPDDEEFMGFGDDEDEDEWSDEDGEGEEDVDMS